MHYLHKILVHIPECGEADSKEELIENIRYRAESETEDYYNQVFDWRETESAGGWSDEYPNQVYFAEDNVEWFINEINQAIESQKRELDYHKKELGEFNLSEIIDKSLKAHEEYDKNPDVVNEYRLYHLNRVSQLLYGTYISDSFIYDVENRSARVYPYRLDAIRENPKEWALVMFDYHN